MKPKTFEHDGKTYIVADDKGNPVYVHSDGKEVGFDVVGTASRIGGLNKEAQTHRETLEAAQSRLKAFEGIEDPEAARNALSTVASLKGGDIKTAQQVEEIKREAQKAAEQQVQAAATQSASRIKELETALGARTSELYEHMVGGAFEGSKFIKEKCAYPASMLRDTFGRGIKVEEGKLVPYGPDGNKLFSRARPGEYADFEEGIEMLVDAHPYKAQILKGTGQSGTGSQPASGGQTANGKPTMTRTAFEALPPTQQAATVKTHAIVDGPTQ